MPDYVRDAQALPLRLLLAHIETSKLQKIIQQPMEASNVRDDDPRWAPHSVREATKLLLGGGTILWRGAGDMTSGATESAADFAPLPLGG